MRTVKEYKEALYAMRPNIWIGEEKVGREDWRIKGGINIIKETYACAMDPKYEDLCTAISHFTGNKINRFTHIHQSKEDLYKKQRMTRVLCHRVGGCIQRCMGIDALNALSVVTYECDQALKTDYYERFKKYMIRFQNEDLSASCASTDAKGDRSKRPHEQANPDAYVHIVENREDGIVVRGAKQCITNTPYVDEIVSVPCRYLGPEDNDYAVAFAIPADWEGVELLARPAWVHGVQDLPEDYDFPTMELGDVETMIIFDDTFIPKERVFLNGVENPNATAYGGFLALLFAHFHRHSYTGCKPAVSEILASCCSLAAEYNNIEDKKHVTTKISHLIGTAELVFAAGESSALHSEKSASGTQVPDEVLTNAGRRLAGENIYEEYKILADISGGIIATLPYLETFTKTEIGPLALKYLERNPKVSTDKALKIIKGIETLGVSDIAGVLQVAGLHGGGSPQMETIAMMGRYPMRDLKKIASYLFGLKSKPPRYERSETPVTPRELLKRYEKAMKWKMKNK